MTQRVIIIIIGSMVIAVPVVLVVLFYLRSVETPEPEVTTDPATETEQAPAAPGN